MVTAAMVDYNPLNGSLTIPAGSCQGSIALTLIDDQIFEENKSFFYSLHSNNPNIVINSSRTSAQVLLTDGDGKCLLLVLQDPSCSMKAYSISYSSISYCLLHSFM